MGSNIKWWAELDTGAEIQATFEEVEACASRFRADSELSRLNSDPHRQVGISPLLTQLFNAAAEAFELSEGLVDAGVLPAVRAAGYDADLPIACREAAAPVPVEGWQNVVLGDGCIFRPPGLEIDLGGIAKGWTAARALEASGAGLVDAGGDIATEGLWQVTVRHNDLDVAKIAVESAAVATSGIDRRRWTSGHHLIDPRSGAPSRTDVVAATVIADDLCRAETIAKTIVLRGSWEGLGWAESLSDVRGALVTTDNGATIGLPCTKEVLI